MNYGLSVSFLLAMVIYSGCAGIRSGRMSRATEAEKRRIAHRVEQIINGIDSTINLGIKIKALDSGEVIYEKNPSRHFTPGSTIKLITVASALYYLGPYHRFRTKLFADEIKAGRIKNLFIKGSGDPSLMDHDIAALAAELRQMGVKEIAQDILVDDKVFDDVLWSKGAMWDDRSKGYAAPVCGLNINYNRVLIKTIPAHKPGPRAHSLLRPASPYLNIDSQASTREANKNTDITVEIDRRFNKAEGWPKVTQEGLREGDRLLVSGGIARNSAPHHTMLAISDPPLFAGKYLREQLKALGIKVGGSVRRQETPSKATLLTFHESRSLAEALIDFTKISNNVANDALVKTIAAHAGSTPASHEAGLKLIDRFLSEQVGIDPKGMVSADGSGLSRYNLITPDQMVKLLDYAGNSFDLAPEFIASLPIGGEDGTLSRRLTSGHARGNIRAKSGTMSGISCLAGYLNDERGKRFAFSIMINGIVGRASRYAAMQDQILRSFFDDERDKKLANVK